MQRRGDRGSPLSLAYPTFSRLLSHALTRARSSNHKQPLFLDNVYPEGSLIDMDESQAYRDLLCLHPAHNYSWNRTYWYR